MVAKQCMRGGLLRFINKDIFWGGKRPFREMIANAHILTKGIKTTEMTAYCLGSFDRKEHTETMSRECRERHSRRRSDLLGLRDLP